MHLTVIIPVHNGGEDFRRCLVALSTSTRAPDEIIVVDDASTDGSAAVARAFTARVLPLTGGPYGPAVARNRGAALASGDVLVFIDADVAVHADTLAQMEQALTDHPEIAALFGSYDDRPSKPGLVTRYKNLQHHYVHQHGQREASTFWAGAGAVRRSVFADRGGFDERYTRPSIEDIEFGVRLKRAGHRIWLCKDIQVTHLKKWTLISWLRADIFGRAVPWTQLILATRSLPSDLNLDTKSRLSAVVAWGLVLSLAAGFWLPGLWIIAVACLVAMIALNRRLHVFYSQYGGLWFGAGAFSLNVLYYLYGSATFLIVFILYLVRNSHNR